jgi:hypothetical protein
MLINHLVILWIPVSNEKVKFIFRSRERYADNITIVNSNGTKPSPSLLVVDGREVKERANLVLDLERIGPI